MHLVNGISSNSLEITDRGLQYGDGLFETIAVKNGRLLFWPLHMERLNEGCRVLKIQTPDMKLLEEEALSVSKDVDKAILKIIVTRGRSGRGYKYAKAKDTTRIVSLYPWPEYPEDYQDGIRVHLCKSTISTNPNLAGIKHMNRLENIMARMEWDDETIAEGLLLTENGLVIEGIMSNVFSVRNNKLLTPDVTECGVRGVTRSIIMDIAKECSIDVEVRKLTLEDIRAADEIFFCNSIIGIWPVIELELQPFSAGPITKRLQEKLNKRTENPDA